MRPGTMLSCVAATLIVMTCLVNSGRTDETGDLFTDLRLEPVAEGLTSPHYLVTPPGDDRRFVVDLVGRIIILEEDGTPRDVPFLDVSSRLVTLRASYDERGLLGLAFHPEYEDNGRFFVHYSAPLRDDGPAGWDHTGRVSEFRVSADDPDRADPDSERILLQIDQPQFNHNGSRVLFGPDGYLYVGLGDGGGAGDTDMGHPPLGHGQDVTTLLGSILRIDVDQEPYGIPAGNPLVGRELAGGAEYSGEEVREEIWAWGIRASWGMSFDRETDEFYVADVGQDLWEEVNRMESPGNYGWNIKEGTHWFDPQDMQRVVEEGPETGPMGEPLIDPVIEYRNARGHDEGIGICVIGGHVYRGGAIEELRGHFVFGDWTRRQEEAAGVVIVSRPQDEETETADATWPVEVAIRLDSYVLGFGEDADGELYVLTSDERGPSGSTGRVFRIVRGQ